MAKEYSINVPIIALKPAEQIIDYLNGKASLAIVNPFFDLPGFPKIPFANFLSIKPINGQRQGYQIVSPQIVYKTQTGTFTSKIIFTDDDGSTNLTTNVRFYPLREKQLTIQDYVANFKVLQKVVASRGVVKDSNSSLINECVINYQLSQAYELALMLKMCGLQLDPNDTDLIILRKINLAINGQEKPETNKRINDYIKFNTTPAPGTEDARYIKSYNQTMMNMFGRNGPVIQSIIDIFQDDMTAKGMQLSQVQQKSQLDVLFEQYNTVLRAAKYQNMGSACYVKEYQGSANGQSYQGKSFYTDYTLKIADKSSQKTMMKIPSMGNAPPRTMTVKDYLDLVSDGTTTNPLQASPKSIVAKIFMGIDFDFRVYSTLANKQAINIRYLVHLIFYKQSEQNILNTIDYGNVYMPAMEMEGGESQGTQLDYGNVEFDHSQQTIPVVDNFGGQMM